MELKVLESRFTFKSCARPSLNPLSASRETLKDWPEANWQSFVFGNPFKCFHTSQTANTFSSFTVISLVDARDGSFPFRSHLRRSFEVLPIG
jgi:hypothetical protein